MVTLATNGITSMSTRPIQLITILGFLVSLFSFAMIIYCIIDWFSGRNVPGYTTSLVVSLLMGGLTIFSLGIVGEYIGTVSYTHLDVYKRQRYVRLPDLLIDLEMARSDGTYKKVMAKYANPLVLILSLIHI